MTIHIVNDLMNAAADALLQLDVDRLSALRAIVEGWMQTEAERNAQLAMIEAMMNAAEELQGWQDDAENMAA